MALGRQQKRRKPDVHVQAKSLVQQMEATVTGIADHIKKLLSPQPVQGGFNFSKARYTKGQSFTARSTEHGRAGYHLLLFAAVALALLKCMR